MDERLRLLERLSRYNFADIQRLARLLEARRVQRLVNSGRSLRAALRTINWGRSSAGRALSRTEYRQLLAQLQNAQTRQRLAQFIRTLRSNRATASYARGLVRAGRASRIVSAVGSTLGRVRASIGTFARFPIAAPWLALAVICVLGVGLAIYYVTRETAEERTAKIASAVNCDCANIGAGILNIGWIPECRGHEKKLQKIAAAGKLNIEVNNDGIITGGNLCGWPDNGPAAWPVKGSPGRPPE